MAGGRWPSIFGLQMSLRIDLDDTTHSVHLRSETFYHSGHIFPDCRLVDGVMFWVAYWKTH